MRDLQKKPGALNNFEHVGIGGRGTGAMRFEDLSLGLMGFRA